MNSFHDKDCQYCGSRMALRRSRPHCTGNNLHSVKAIFDSVLSLQSEPDQFSRRVADLQSNELVFDLFVDYWKKKKIDPTVNLLCLHEETYFRDINPGEPKLPIPEPNIPFPDLVEVHIAEIMLGRELTSLEKDGQRWIPKIDQETGQDYFAPLTWVKWPLDYISLKDMYLKTDYNEPAARVVFDVQQIRGKYKERDGGLIDG